MTPVDLADYDIGKTWVNPNNPGVEPKVLVPTRVLAQLVAVARAAQEVVRYNERFGNMDIHGVVEELATALATFDATAPARPRGEGR